jgi:hypothetical protein
MAFSIKKSPPAVAKNIIEKEADRFIDSQLGADMHFSHTGQIEKIISNLNKETGRFYEPAQIAEYLERVRYILQVGKDNHILVCPHKDGLCGQDEMFERLQFFVQNEINRNNSHIEPRFLSPDQKDQLTLILEKLDVLTTSADFTYSDIWQEFQDLKSMYFLPKKNLSQVLSGKFAEMSAGGIIGEAVSKPVVDWVKNHWNDIVTILR